MISRVPKTKEEELIDTLANWDFDKVMSEFTAHRLLAYSESISDSDVKKVYQAFIYLYSRKIKCVYSLLDQLKSNLKHQWFFRNCKFLAHRTAYILYIADSYLPHWDKIHELDAVSKQDTIENFPFFFFLSGRLHEAKELFHSSLKNQNFVSLFDEIESTDSISIEATNLKLIDLDNFQKKYQIDNMQLIAFSDQLQKIILKYNINIKIIDYFLIDEDMLITLQLNEEIDLIHKLNDEFFEMIYNNNLINIQNLLSLNFSPLNLGEKI